MDGAAVARDLRRDASMVLACMVIGAGFGALHNAVDSQISPDFYIHFKDAPPAAVWQRAVHIGLTRGAVMGALLGVLLCIASDRPDRPPLSVPATLLYALPPILFAAMGSATGAGIGWQVAGWFVERSFPALRGVPPQICVVYGMHQGVYIGAFLGAAITWRMLRKPPPTLPPTP